MEEQPKEEMIAENAVLAENQEVIVSEKEEKFKRKIVALTVGAVLLLVILCSVLIYQLIKIAILNKENNKLDNLYEYYQTLNDEEKEKIDATNTIEFYLREGYKRGYKQKGDLS